MFVRPFLPSAALLLAVGCGTSVPGTLVDGITGEPLVGTPGEENALRLIADAVTEGEDGRFEANREAGLTCQSFSGEIGTDGSFRLSDLCLSSSGYRLRLSDNNYFLGETDFLPQGSDGTPRTIKVWHAPMGSGVKILKDGRHLRITSRVSLKSETIKGTEDSKVHYPTALPGNVPLIEKGSKLIVTGMSNKDIQLFPLINSGAREFKIEEGMETGPTMQPWSYLGTRFTDDETFERVQVSLDDSKIVRVEHRGHFAKFVPAEAVTPPGRYALWVEGQPSAFVVDFVEAGSAPKAEEPAEEE